MRAEEMPLSGVFSCSVSPLQTAFELAFHSCKTQQGSAFRLGQEACRERRTGGCDFIDVSGGPQGATRRREGIR